MQYLLIKPWTGYKITNIINRRGFDANKKYLGKEKKRDGKKA